MEKLTSLTRAYALACSWHAGQRRKGDAREPYVNHLAEVADLVARATGDINLTIAAILHDAIEDAGVTGGQIEAEFGGDVAKLVQEVTDDKSLPKAERKRRQEETAPHKSAGAKMIKLADKTSNLRAILNSPPPWPLERKREYLAWARRVIAGVRGVSSSLEAGFDAAASELEAQLASSN